MNHAGDATGADSNPPYPSVAHMMQNPEIEASNTNALPQIEQLQQHAIAPSPTQAFPTPAAPPALMLSSKSRFKYKYTEAGENGGCPGGVTEEDWNKIYTAADSRIYNKHSKNANQSRARRATGETRELALAMLAERAYKPTNIAPSPTDSTSPSIAPIASTKPYKPKSSSSRVSYTTSYSPEEPPIWQDNIIAEGKTPLSVSEQIKMEGRSRKSATQADDFQDGAGLNPSAVIGAPVARAPKPRKKPGPKKKGSAAATKKIATKAKADVVMTTPSAMGNRKTPALAENSPDRAASLDSDDDESGSDNGIYCICKKPDDHRLMLACEGGCEDWYHCSCMKIAEADVDEDRNGLLDRFICPLCTIQGGDNPKITTWKPMCRMFNINGCRKAARVHLDPPSKYCSQEHGKAFCQYILDKQARADNAPSMGGRLNREEIGTILTHATTYEQIQALGKKPRLPAPASVDQNQLLGLNYLTDEEKIRIEDIRTKRSTLETRIQTLQQQQKLAEMINMRHKAALNDAKCKAEFKDPCGYDSRISFNETQYIRWAASSESSVALSTGALGPHSAETSTINKSIPCPSQPATDESIHIPHELQNMCLKPKKKCTKHKDWFATHMYDFKFQEKLLRDELKRLQAKEDEIVDDAETREATKDYYAENTTEVLF